MQRISANAQGFAPVGQFITFGWNVSRTKKLKMKKQTIADGTTSARTKDEQETEAENMHVSPTGAKPSVSSRLMSLHPSKKHELASSFFSSIKLREQDKEILNFLKEERKRVLNEEVEIHGYAGSELLAGERILSLIYGSKTDDAKMYEGVLLGLKICKEMWAQGQLSHENIYENEIYYKELLSNEKLVNGC